MQQDNIKRIRSSRNKLHKSIKKNGLDSNETRRISDEMDKLINELLLLAKIENVDDVKDYEKFNLSEYIETITSMFESMAYEKQVKIITKIQIEKYLKQC